MPAAGVSDLNALGQSWLGHPNAWQWGDFNADGIADLAATTPDDGGVSVLLGTGKDGRGDGFFDSVEVFPTGPGPMSVVASDIDWDHVHDLTVACADSGDLVSLTGEGSGGRGNGRFELPQVLAPVSAPTEVLSGDWNRDGIVDLAIALFGRYGLPFEAASLLLLATMVAVIVLAKRQRGGGA